MPLYIFPRPSITMPKAKQKNASRPKRAAKAPGHYRENSSESDDSSTPPLIDQHNEENQALVAQIQALKSMVTKCPLAFPPPIAQTSAAAPAPTTPAAPVPVPTTSPAPAHVHNAAPAAAVLASSEPAHEPAPVPVAATAINPSLSQKEERQSRKRKKGNYHKWAKRDRCCSYLPPSPSSLDEDPTPNHAPAPSLPFHVQSQERLYRRHQNSSRRRQKDTNIIVTALGHLHLHPHLPPLGHPIVSYQNQTRTQGRNHKHTTSCPPLAC